MSAVLPITTYKQFVETVQQPGKPVIVDFHAEWCGPCKAMAPLFEKLAREHGDKMVFCEVDIDTVPDAAHGVNSIPTFHLYKNGSYVSEVIGANKTALTSLVVSNV